MQSRLRDLGTRPDIGACNLFLAPFVMAQANFDRRRINGPDESYQPIFESEDEEETRWKPGSPRKGRGARNIRPICMISSSWLDLHISHLNTRVSQVLTAGLINQANGSAYIETERTKIACAV